MIARRDQSYRLSAGHWFLAIQCQSIPKGKPDCDGLSSRTARCGRNETLLSSSEAMEVPKLKRKKTQLISSTRTGPVCN